MADQEVSKIMWIAIVVALGASVFVIAKPQINSLAGQTFDKIGSIVKGDDSGGGGDDGGGNETPPEEKATLVAPTGVLKAETSAFGVSDGMLTLPDSLTDSKGEDVSVTAKIVGTSGEVQNGKLAAGNYDVQYFAEGYDSVTQKAEVTQPEEVKVAALVAPANVSLTTPGYGKTVAFTAPTTLKDADGNTVNVNVSVSGQGVDLKALKSGTYTLTYVDTDNKRKPVTQTVTVKDPAALVAPANVSLTTPGYGKTIAFTAPTTLKDADGNTVNVNVSVSGQSVDLKALKRGTYTLTYADTSNKRQPVTQTVTVKDKVNTPTFTVKAGGRGSTFYVSGDANAPYEIRHTGLNKTIKGTFDAQGNNSYSEQALASSFGMGGSGNSIYDDRSKLQIRVVQPDGSSTWVTCKG